MRHRVSVKKLGRSADERKALYRSLALGLVNRGRVKTTLAKAKAARPWIEKLVTLAKRGDLTARRRLLKFIPQKKIVARMISEIGPRFKNRPGGYLRIVKLGPRLGDRAEMARLEWTEEMKNEK